MPSLSGDGTTGRQDSGPPFLVFRLEAAALEIGFGTVNHRSRSSTNNPVESGTALLLSVKFPESGETRTFEVFSMDECGSLLDGSTKEPIKIPQYLAPGRLVAFSLDVLSPFAFSGLAYDPLGSIAASVARLAVEGTGTTSNVSKRPGGGSGRPVKSSDGLMALWAVVEADLYRFAKDPGFTAALDTAEREQPEEYRRFARLNDLYRGLVKVLVPYGLAPRRWTAWLRGQDYQSLLPLSLALRVENFLGRCASQPKASLAALARVLVRHGALVMVEHN